MSAIRTGCSTAAREPTQENTQGEKVSSKSIGQSILARCPGAPPKSDVELTSAASTIVLHDSDLIGSGANNERVDVIWQFAFDASAAGRIYEVEAAATDDDGFAQPFEPIGTLAIGTVCAGDCGADGTVAVSELVLAVNIATGELPLDACLAADENRNGTVEMGDLIAAVNHALSGCPER